MAATSRFSLVDTLCHSPQSHIWITFIKLLPKTEYGFCQMNDNQDFCQDGLSVCKYGHFHMGHQILKYLKMDTAK